MNAPIALFLFNRVNHAKLTIDALSACQEASSSSLFVFCDGPKLNSTESDLQAINEIRTFASQINGFKSVELVLHQNNLGLSNSIIYGINKVLELNETVIVIEDDVLVGKDFLMFMNAALNKYLNVANVAGISGYSFPIRINDPFFTRTGSCWGWATYKKVWQGFIKQKNELHVDFITSEEKQLFNVYDKLYETMFIQNKQAMIQSWAVDFYLYYFLNKLYFLMPGKNLVNNIGFDGSGAHKKNGNFLTNNNPISNILHIELPNIIEEKPLIRKKIIQLYRDGLTKPTKLKRILNKFKRLLKLK